MAVMLIGLMILTLLAAIAIRNTRSEIALTGQTQINLRDNLAAESAVNWALAELGRPRGDWAPFTKATHDPSGLVRLSDTLPDGTKQGRLLRNVEVYPIHSGATIAKNDEGWIYTYTMDATKSISGLVPEKFLFKVWYPETPVNTVRISAKSIAGKDKDTTRVEFIGTFKNAFIPRP